MKKHFAAVASIAALALLVACQPPVKKDNDPSYVGAPSVGSASDIDDIEADASPTVESGSELAYYLPYIGYATLQILISTDYSPLLEASEAPNAGVTLQSAKTGQKLVVPAKALSAVYKKLAAAKARALVSQSSSIDIDLDILGPEDAVIGTSHLVGSGTFAYDDGFDEDPQVNTTYDPVQTTSAETTVTDTLTDWLPMELDGETLYVKGTQVTHTKISASASIVTGAETVYPLAAQTTSGSFEAGWGLAAGFKIVPETGDTVGFKLVFTMAAHTSFSDLDALAEEYEDPTATASIQVTIYNDADEVIDQFSAELGLSANPPTVESDPE